MEPLRLLVIDDDDGIRAMLHVALSIEGFEVHLAENGFEGLALAREVRPDVIILDIMMPRLDGHEVLRAMRNSDELADIPVVMASALSADDQVWEGFVGGADSYLCKPYDLADLLEEIGRVAPGRAVPA